MSNVAECLSALHSFARRAGASVDYANLPNCIGGCLDHDRILLRAGLAPEQELLTLEHVTRLEGPAGTGRSTRDTDTPLAQGEQELLTLVHELTHVMAHGASARSRTQRTVCEYEAEAVECLIAQRLGFGASGFEAFTGEVCTFPDGLLADSVARVGAVASTLLAVLDRQPLARFTP